MWFWTQNPFFFHWFLLPLSVSQLLWISKVSCGMNMSLAKYQYLGAEISGKFVKQNKVGEYLVFSLFSYRRPPPPSNHYHLLFAQRVLGKPQNFTFWLSKICICSIPTWAGGNRRVPCRAAGIKGTSLTQSGILENRISPFDFQKFAHCKFGSQRNSGKQIVRCSGIWALKSWVVNENFLEDMMGSVCKRCFFTGACS